MNDIQIRRIIFEKDALKIKEMQIHAPEFSEHYPRHSQWLDMAISEIVEGKRYAFGIYRIFFSDNSKAAVELIGSIIIKKEVYTKAFQLKNLYLKPEWRRKGYGSELFKVVEQFCTKLGGIQIKTEVPSIETNTVNFLNSKGFFVQEHSDSPYNRNEKMYRLIKILPNTYIGDPFDLQEIAKWIFENIYHFKIISTQKDLYKYIIPLKDNLSKISQIQIVGSAKIYDSPFTNVEEVNSSFKEENENIRSIIVRSGNNNLSEYCSKNGIQLLDSQMIKTHFVNELSIEFPDFEKEKIGGMIVAINFRYYKPLKQSSSNFTYFKGGPVGKFLQENNLILFSFEENPEFADGGIKAYGKVVKSAFGDASKIWNEFNDSNPLFNEPEYRRWAAGHSEIVAITITDLKFIKTMNVRNLSDSSSSSIFDNERLGQYYLSDKSLIKFLDTKQDSISSSFNDSSVIKVFLSSTIEDLLPERGAVIDIVRDDLSYNIFSSENAGSFTSPRETIIKELESSDIYICIVGERYGYEANFDDRKISATHDEFLNAKKLNKRIILYVKTVTSRDKKLDEFLKEIGDYHLGQKFQKFSSLRELKEAIKKDIARVLRPN